MAKIAYMGIFAYFITFIGKLSDFWGLCCVSFAVGQLAGFAGNLWPTFGRQVRGRLRSALINTFGDKLNRKTASELDQTEIANEYEGKEIEFEA